MTVVHHLEMAYPNGAIRISRTKGRQETKNCISLPDILQKEHLKAACICSTLVAEDKLYKHLPLKNFPIYIVRDMELDSEIDTARRKAKIAPDKSLTPELRKVLIPILQRLHEKKHGKNPIICYTLSASQNSNILLLKYTYFLRIVITSCMNVDTEEGDNHWYIHDLPNRWFGDLRYEEVFERQFFRHIAEIVPQVFMSMTEDSYDFSAVKVRLVTAVCGSPTLQSDYGLLYLRKYIEYMDLGLPKLDKSSKLRLEVCTARVGDMRLNMPLKWLNCFYDCALGKATFEVENLNTTLPRITLYYPTKEYVLESPQRESAVAENLACHAPPQIWSLFNHYKSKDPGELSNQNMILAYNPLDTTLPPYYVYFGSADLSIPSWGIPTPGCENIFAVNQTTCGVLIPGDLIEDLLEPGTKSWQEGIVTYVQTAHPYNFSTDSPWIKDNVPLSKQHFDERPRRKR
ncbi:phospholipase D/nuclease [Nemania abortiva]|nr:phospholipase D/nuclease [Nemania abortiva]